MSANSYIMTIKEFSEYLKIAEKNSYRFALEKKILGFKIGGAWWFCRKEIDEWIVKQSK